MIPLLYPSLAGQKLVDVLQLMRTPQVGPITFFNLIQRFGTADAALSALPALAARGGRKNPLVAFNRDEAYKEIEAVEKFGARLIMYGSPDYPALLHTIPDPPPVIAVLGNTHLWNKDCIAMVGARNASANGCQFAGRLARELGEAGLTVVSGLARGIDTFTHKGSLASGTVAVIAGGIDTIYPPENEALTAQIRTSGAIISEQPFAALPFAGSFPGRNRIIAGMSLGVAVVEASPKSGSLITARFALENNREVFAVPGSPLDPRSKGCNQLIKQGATMVEAASDIIQGVAHLRGGALEETKASPYIEAETQAPTESEVDAAREVIARKLSVISVSVDELVEQCQTSASVTLTVLLEFELAGRLKRSAGNKVSLVAQFEEEVA